MQNEIHLAELWNAIWLKWKVISGLTAIAALASVFYSLSLPNMYQATALLTPSKSSDSGGSISASFGGLASLAGLDLTSIKEGNSVGTAVKVITSRKFGTTLIEKYNLLPDILAVESWDEHTKKITYIEDSYNSDLKTYIPKVDEDHDAAMWSAFKTFSTMLVVEHDKTEGFIYVTVNHRSPIVAKNWVDLIVSEVNETMRLKVIEEAQKSQSYLNEKLQTVQIADMKALLFQLIEEQVKTTMLAKIKDEYVFTTIDPAVVERERSSPNRAVICIVGTLFGAIASVLLVTARHLGTWSKLSFN